MSPDPKQSVLSRKKVRNVGITLGVLAVVVVVIGVTTRKMADARLSEWTENQATPAVAVARPGTEAKQMSLELPGRLEAYSQAQLYARVSGYIKEWKADIGTVVKTGQLLAEIDAPDLDQQIMQAEATLTSAQANAALSRANLERGQSLMQSGSVSKQDLDSRTADASNKQGIARAAAADLARMRVLEKYKQITAPFDGLVTARATDIGSLISAGSSGGPPLFVVSDIVRLRAYVNVPQTYVPNIRVGTRATLSVPEYPGRNFTATVESSAQSVDVASGTTRMQLAVDNSKGELMTGAFVNVHLDLPRERRVISVPASALIFDQNGMRVATVGADNRVSVKRVVISRDLGKEVEIASGVEEDDNVVVTPPDGITEGDTVRVTNRPGAAVASEPAPGQQTGGKPRS
jgi:RND family efflux transporter MFP subunit